MIRNAGISQSFYNRQNSKKQAFNGEPLDTKCVDRALKALKVAGGGLNTSRLTVVASENKKGTISFKVTLPIEKENSRYSHIEGVYKVQRKKDGGYEINKSPILNYVSRTTKSFLDRPLGRVFRWITGHATLAQFCEHAKHSLKQSKQNLTEILTDVAR